MSVLVIGVEEREQIGQLRAHAARRIQDVRTSIAMATGDLTEYREFMGQATMTLPVGYQVTYSHELQQQTLLKHISISVERPGRMPSIAAVELILEAFAMQPVAASVDLWIEKVDRDRKAINILQPVLGIDAG